jgi:hypothetical protein
MHEFDHHRRFRKAWESVRIVRPVRYSLFTFGDSTLPYLLVCGGSDSQTPSVLTRGAVKISRPMIITPESAKPEFRGFFENAEEEGVLQFLMARKASFSNLKFQNQHRAEQTLHEPAEDVIARLNRQLDDEEEDNVAILASPTNLGGVAVLRYTAERVWQSGPDNIQELRERGFLP